MFDKIEVTRQDNKTIEMKWSHSKGRTKVDLFMSTDPDDLENGQQIGSTTASFFNMENLRPDNRHYFMLKAGKNRSEVFAERVVELEGSVNFRDLGGYLSNEKIPVKWGKVFRSDGLSKLSFNDVNLLNQIGLKTIVDFRTSREVDSSPDVIPNKKKVQYLHLPIKSGEFTFVSALELLRNNSDSWPTDDFMMKNYLSYVEQSAGVWREVFELLADPENLPLVFHCSAGKDRTGACSALILRLLGISREDIIADHQLSNLYIKPITNEIIKKLKEQGLDSDKLLPFLTAPLNGIEAFLNMIDTQFSSVESYLKSVVGLSEECLANIKINLSLDSRM